MLNLNLPDFESLLEFVVFEKVVYEIEFQLLQNLLVKIELFYLISLLNLYGCLLPFVKSIH